MDTKEALKRWHASVEFIEECWYDYEDVMDDELARDLMLRGYIEEEKLTSTEKAELIQLDERFRKALYPALRHAKSEGWYIRTGKDYPSEEWWWHVKEEE